MVWLDGVTSDWFESWSSARPDNPGLRPRLSRLLSFWRWSESRWRSISFRSEVPFGKRHYVTNPEGAAKERLDHYLVRTGFASSRRVAQELVERGLVRIN